MQCTSNVVPLPRAFGSLGRSHSLDIGPLEAYLYTWACVYSLSYVNGPGCSSGGVNLTKKVYICPEPWAVVGVFRIDVLYVHAHVCCLLHSLGIQSIDLHERSITHTRTHTS